MYGRWKEPGQVTPLNVWELSGMMILVTSGDDKGNFSFRAGCEGIDLGSLNVYYDFQADILKYLRMKRLRVSFYMEEISKISSIKAERGLIILCQNDVVFAY
ncbi:MAG: hypothetical protein ACLU4J_23605 [Butyricimonas paravirosa]